MLILDSEIYFDPIEINPQARTRDLDTRGILRPAINFGNNVLCTGTLIASRSIPILTKGIWYSVLIEMPTVEEETYEKIKDLLVINNIFKIQEASRVIGRGKILDYIYE